MKTWEMIKELTENPDKEFTRKSDGLHIKTNEYGELVWDSGYQFLRLHHEWKEIKQPVDFMTAFKAWHDDRKTIIHELEYEGDIITATMFDGKNEYAEFGAGLIANGKWYIED